VASVWPGAAASISLDAAACELEDVLTFAVVELLAAFVTDPERVLVSAGAPESGESFELELLHARVAALAVPAAASHKSHVP